MRNSASHRGAPDDQGSASADGDSSAAVHLGGASGGQEGAGIDIQADAAGAISGAPAATDDILLDTEGRGAARPGVAVARGTRRGRR